MLKADPGISYNLKLFLGWIDYEDSEHKLSSSFLNTPEALQSVKNFNDIYFEKHVTFTHLVKNVHSENKTLSVSIFEYFPFYLQLYTKDIQIDIFKPPMNNTEAKTAKSEVEHGIEFPQSGYVPNGYVRHEYKDYQLDFDKVQGSGQILYQFKGQLGKEYRHDLSYLFKQIF